MSDDAHILIATQETDERLRQQEISNGRQAKIDGKKPSDCPWRGGMMEYWWFEGYDSIKVD